MSFDQDIADIRARIAKAGSERDHWRFSNRQEKYFAAHRLVHALELELDRLRKQRLRGERYAHELDLAVEPPRHIPSFIRRASLS
jgi:hypothetical protein